MLILLRQVQWKASVVQVYSRALSAEMQKRARSWNDGHSPLSMSQQNLLLWIETLRFLTTMDVDSKKGVRRNLRLLVKAMQFAKFEDYMDCLKEVAWMDGMFEKELANFWTESKNASNK